VVFFTFSGMSRRFAHGATRRPPHGRPGNGYGRSTKPGPCAWGAPAGVGPLSAPELDDVITMLVVSLDLVDEERRDVGAGA
jgi:hypothetical protein